MVTKYIKVMSDLQGYFKDGQREQIYNAIPEVYKNQRYAIQVQALIRLLWVSGRRISEILASKVYDIDFEKNLMLFIILKKGSDKQQGEIKAKRNLKKYKYIDKKTLDILKFHIFINKLNKDDWLFPHKDNRLIPTSRFMAHRIVRKLCKHVGIERVGTKKPHCHHFRHSLAVQFAEKSTNPKDIRLIQDQLEHSTLSVTEQYLQFNPKEIKDLYERAGYC